MRRLSPLLLLVAACSTPEPDHPADTSECAAHAESARQRVASVAANNLSCLTDQDCRTVRVVATCFDACHAAVNEVGFGAVDRAGTLVEASECRKFHAGGCAVTEPACPPLRSARCQANSCVFADAPSETAPASYEAAGGAPP